MKKLFAVLLSLALLMSLVPLGTITASAATFGVYIDGVGLADGEYLPNGSSTTTTTKPSGGYAHYYDGTLTLNNYTSSGSGMFINKWYSALVYSEKALTLKLNGTNSLTDTGTSCIAVWVDGGNLTVTAEDGAILNVTASADGLSTVGGGVAISGGNINIQADQSGISADGDLTISGSQVDIVGHTQAIEANNVVLNEVKAQASTTTSGTLVDYVADNFSTYKRVVSKVFDVYVGAVGLVNGEFLAVGSSEATTTNPGSKHAYYNSGILILNNYTYDGAGRSVPGYPSYTALVYSEKALDIQLVGNNKLTNTANRGMGIWVDGDVTIANNNNGDLSIVANSTGIYTKYGDITIKSGTVSTTSNDDGICAYEGDVSISGGTVNVDAVDKGICASYNATISGGTVIVNAEEYGIMADGNLTISDGNVTVVSTDNLGICGDDSLTISGGKIIVNAYDEGLYANGDTVISGGNVTVYAGYGIYAYDNVDISGGTVTVDADTMGIYTCYGNLTISGGTVTVYDCNDAAVAEEKNIVVSGGTVHLYDCNYGLFTEIGSVVIEGGKITIEAECDAINSYDNALISGGELDLISTDLASDENYSAIRCHAILLVENITLYAATDPDNAVGTFSLTKLNDYDRIISSCAEHTYSNACDKSCNVCGYTRTPSAHKGGTATCKVKAKCTVCGESYGSLKAHSYEKKTTKATLTKDGIIKNVCKTCGYTASKTTTIAKVTSVAFKKATTTYDGTTKKPSVVVKDSKGNTISSSHYTVTYPSGMKNAGTYKVTVKFKGNYSGTKTLTYTIKGIDVSKCKVSFKKATTTYDGTVKTPTVVVKNANGTTLTKGTHYTVTYPSGMKAVGTYKVKVTMKGNYSGTKTLTYKINPAATTLSKLTSGTKKLTVSWTKKSAQVTGYQIQYSTSKKFTSAKTKTITSYKTTKTTLTGLKAKTTYYVRIRTYKTVNGVKYYSGWSTYKYTKTK